MKSMFALSLSLVAFSGGAGLGLSILHDYSTSVQTAALASPEIQSDATSGFVIPQHVPSVTLPSLAAPALPQPVAAATAPVIELPALTTQTAATVRPQMRSAAVAALATPKAQTKPAQALPTARAAVKKQPQRSDVYNPRAKARAQAPTGYVAQAFTTLDGLAPRNGPDYVVGVYR
ncbi:MAG: hypothetical protein AAF214_09490 [Pseudomonadota bacterium]